jgi:hypothetical protein
MLTSVAQELILILHYYHCMYARLHLFILHVLSRTTILYTCACIIWPSLSALSVKENIETTPAKPPGCLTLVQIVISLTDVTTLLTTLS